MNPIIIIVLLVVLAIVAVVLFSPTTAAITTTTPVITLSTTTTPLPTQATTTTTPAPADPTTTTTTPVSSTTTTTTTPVSSTTTTTTPISSTTTTTTPAPVTIFTSSTWYTSMSRSGAASAVSGVNPDVESRIVNGGQQEGGQWTIKNLPLNTYKSLTFEGQILWAGLGDYYGVTFGNISVLFNFWDGFVAGAFSGIGTYILKNGTAVAKTSESPEGPGRNIWFPLKFVYTRSLTNTWQAFINNKLAISYNDPDALTWGTSGSKDVAIFAHSGGNLNITVVTKANNLTST